MIYGSVLTKETKSEIYGSEPLQKEIEENFDNIKMDYLKELSNGQEGGFVDSVENYPKFPDLTKAPHEPLDKISMNHCVH